MIFEGADRVGKDTAAIIYNEISNYQDLVIVRAFYSNYIYDIKYERGDPIVWAKYLSEINRSIPSPVVIVLMVAKGKQLKRLNSEYHDDQKVFMANFDSFIGRTGSVGIVVEADGNKQHLRKKLRELYDFIHSADYVSMRKIVSLQKGDDDDK